MATLYEINTALRDVLEQGSSVDLETGEVLFDRRDVQDLELALTDKLEGCALYIKEQTALAKAIREEEKALAARRQAIEKRLDQLDGYVLDTLRSVDGGKLETPRCALSMRKSTRTIIDFPELLPGEYREEVTTLKPDKTAIGKAIKAGEVVPGAHSETVLNLQVK